MSFVPRLAGTTWTAGSGISATNELHAVTNGTATVNGVTGNVLVAVGGNRTTGVNGFLFYSTDGISWAAPTSGIPVMSNLNAATSSNPNAAISSPTAYLAAGTGGVILTSPDAITWTQQISTNTTSDLYALASNGAGGYVAVGANGTIIYSNGNGGTTWLAPVAGSGTPNTLYGVTYANGMYVAVGATGTLLTSIDQGATWLHAGWTATSASNTLNSVAYGGASVSQGVTSGTNTFVVVGAAGTLVTSVDGGVSWTLQALPVTTSNLNSVTYGHQFIAVGDSGSVYTSLDGLSWISQTSTTTTPLYAITHRRFDYSAAGGAGLTLHSM